ncbi:glycosyltransferase family 2 protein [Cedecea sp. MMO-103]|uniref:glycosyltransferase family 2 protein n=1 Tax=Cedecea sp. MMO-103 TaxID=3081238 RepID=UPI003016BDC5
MVYEAGKVSVVIISFNHAPYIEECIESILCQNYKIFEIIIIDNNSTDNTNEILEKYSYNNSISIIKLPVNKGVSGGINEGLTRVSGEYVIFFASDDVMVSDRLHKQVNFMRNTPDADACFGNMLRINSDSSVNSNGLLPLVGLKCWSLADILFSRVKLYSPTQMYKTESFMQAVNKLPDDIRIEDIWTYHKFLTKGFKLYTIPHLLTLYRVHPNNTHTKYKMMMNEKIKILDEYKSEDYYKDALNFIYLEHFSNFGSTSKKDALSLLPKVVFNLRSKYLYIGIARLLLDWRR